jgi:N-acetylmuramoyl-L-alanine amidase
MDTLSEIEVVAKTLYGEARGEATQFGVTALEAIASVIWNRFLKRPSVFGATPKAVCLKPYQFSCWLPTDPNYTLLTQSDIQDGVYSLCKMVAHTFLNGEGKDVTNGADHYHSRWIAPPVWAHNTQPIVDIGNHRFYKLI